MDEQKKNQLKEVTERLEQGIKDVYESNRYKEYLKFMGRFHHYSVNNSILIMLQNPDASLVAGYKSWQTKFKRQVRKGEKGISILAPTPYKIKINEEVKDPDTKQPVLDADGNPVLAEKEITLQRFRVVKVFDVSQTVGEPLPLLAEELTGDVANYPLLFRSIEDISPVPVTIEDFPGLAKGYFSPIDQKIVIKEGMSQVQSIKTLIHEVAHAVLHDDKDLPLEQKVSRRTGEVEAESVAFIIGDQFGIDSSDYSFEYLASWSSGKELKELKESLDTIQKTASQLIEDITHRFNELHKEQEQRLAEEMLNTVRHDNEIDLDREKKQPDTAPPAYKIADRIASAQLSAEERAAANPPAVAYHEREAR